ncbi:MAG: hypothetical protein F9K24_22105 [Leptonema illini]|uniref:Uncharacterized protein n=1 Tax=Leptonema illini TaxID=183 RepID=A0A833LYJ3_9LEPT|nr:MAG: hypothetical protein F9K24_22105 [Leptonema illini]
MGLLNLMNCSSIVHKLRTGDGDFGKKIEITANRYEQIRIGITTSEDLDRIFEKQAAHRWTFNKRFRVYWEGHEYRINGMRTYGYISYSAPIEQPGLVVYGWRERRYIELYLTDGVVQFYRFRHDIRDEKGEPAIGPLQNYDPDISDLKKMNGIGCARKIYDVVSLRHTLSRGDQQRFDKYCRPLIIEDEK